MPEFRKNVCLDKAIFRTTMSRSEADAQARFCWETNEYGDEVAASGFWYDHIFHMATVAIGAYQYYEFTQDVSYLKECYRMIRACAKFYTVHMLYTDSDGRVYVGKCTDLERLGPSVENPFMTACGVIKTLECLVKSADVLNIDREYRDECAYLSGKLYESLPKENGEYTPFLGCTQKSVAVFAGKFPFDVIKKDDPCLLPAWNSFMEEETKFGNMYNMGKGVSPWYACWKAEGFARMGMAREAYDALSQVLPTAGKFGELFIILSEHGRRAGNRQHLPSGGGQPTFRFRRQKMSLNAYIVSVKFAAKHASLKKAPSRVLFPPDRYGKDTSGLLKMGLNPYINHYNHPRSGYIFFPKIQNTFRLPGLH